MTDSIKTYTDKKAYEEIYNNIFSGFQAFLKKHETLTPVEFISYFDDAAAFKIASNEIEKNPLIITRDDAGRSFMAFLEFTEKKEKNVYIFKTVKMQVDTIPRHEKRKILDPQNNAGHRVFMINMISEFIIKNSLELYRKRIKQIEETIKVKLDKYFKFIRIFFIHYGKDIRMDYFKEHIMPIIIEDIGKEPDKKKDIYNLYKNTIYPADPHLKNDGLISEISVPVVYNMKIPYGFVQVNNSSPFAESSVQIVKKMAIIINELLKKNNIFPKAEEKLSVIDISKSGIGVVFKDKKCIRFFSENQLLYHDLLLPNSNKVNMLSNVRNILLKGSIYKVGCKIVEVDALSEVYYDEYLESIGITNQ